jgi:hypothetical protein
MDKRSIDEALDRSFEALHWKRMRLCHMPPAFARDVDVSPIFLARPQRSSGHYRIDGHIGVVCQPFERSYIAQFGLPKASGRPHNRPWFAWHIANIDILRNAQYVESEVEIHEFCKLAASCLEWLPHSVTDLQNAFTKGRVLSHPWEQWSFDTEKLKAFEAYLRDARS